MNNTLIAGGIAGFMAVGSFVAGVGTVDIVQTVTAPPAPFTMQLQRLDFENGKFVQSFHITGRAKIQAKWAAEILRGEYHLCSDGGVSVYADVSQRSVSRLTPKQWAGPNCPDRLLPGDVGEAVWTYNTPEGFEVQITGRVVVK